ncbi:hypothetical protein CHUAL_012363 [Chamberlinius hualienensis]
MSGVDSKYDYSDTAQLFATSYVRNSKAIGVLWGIFTLCFAIIDVVAFVQPHWIGDTVASRGSGHFGLWRYCYMVQDSNEVLCVGRLDDFNTIPSSAFRVATVFVGLSVVFVLLGICCLLLFFFFQASTVFHICGWTQLLSAICLVIGVLCYPAGWDSPEVRDVCGPNVKQFYPGDCAIRWSYILAIIGCFDITILATLAFVLGTRYVSLPSTPEKGISLGSIYKGDINSAYVPENQSTTSRKSINLQPMMMMPHPSGESDRYSEYSTRTGRSKSSAAYRADYASSVHNFQL